MRSYGFQYQGSYSSGTPWIHSSYTQFSTKVTLMIILTTSKVALKISSLVEGLQKNKRRMPILFSLSLRADVICNTVYMLLKACVTPGWLLLRSVNKQYSYHAQFQGDFPVAFLSAQDFISLQNLLPDIKWLSEQAGTRICPKQHKSGWWPWPFWPITGDNWHGQPHC